MRVQKITNQNNPKSFKGLRYQSGVKTKNALNAKIKGMIPLLERKCANMRNVDLILTDECKLRLDINKPRYLNEKFQRFYLEENYEIGCNRDNGYISFDNTVEHDYLKISLAPTNQPGIFDVISWYEHPNFSADLSNTLKVAELIEKVSNKIESAEQEHGMDCVSVLNNIDDLTIEAERTKLFDEIKNSYVITHEKKLINNDLKLLYRLRNNKEIVDSFKNYKIALVGNDIDSFIAPCLVDNNGYLDEFYNEFYEKDGLRVQNISDFHKEVKPLSSEYPCYSFGSEDGKTYRVYMDAYEMGRNLSHPEEEHFKRLLSLAERLDKIGESIQQSIAIQTK